MRKLLVIFVLFLMCQMAFGQDLALLKISKDSSYLVTGDDQPFFWLGDTAWELIHRLDKHQIDEYLTDRANKGFTVIQTVVLAELDGLNSPNAYGERPLVDNDPNKLNEQYFTLVDYVLQKANELGLYVALLPTWGDKFNKKWGVGPEIFQKENARDYGKLLAERYLNTNNLIWILGGDRALETDSHFGVIHGMATGIRDVDKRHLISFHPVGAKKATDFINEEWLDFDMFQSGHSSTTKEYAYVSESKMLPIKRPVINGEARYENIPDRFWEEKAYGWLDDSDVRVSAYWTMIAGAAGYTYGCNDIWQMYDVSRIPVINARTGWQAALDLPGSAQMGYMRHLFEKLPWQKMKLNQSLVRNTNLEDESYILSSIDSEKKIVIAYTPVGKPFTIDLQKMVADRLNAYWFNPRSGAVKFIGKFETDKAQEFKPWASGKGSDFLLILSDENLPVDFSSMDQ
ncbi:glycoside hydrolase family 140 protein [Algoriphagus vanfongensis]|uniref:glycoside hydrolase family 140 protein n=1 Tax=Algoriphagus vanfongensis TaxID=426371 RepID=UPI00047E98BF|nr:glycoside hydrolase family 140 protein [Algoriphagus vanfongensis]